MGTGIHRGLGYSPSGTLMEEYSMLGPKYWSFSFSISPSNEYSELISFRMDWLDSGAVLGPVDRVANTMSFLLMF